MWRCDEYLVQALSVVVFGETSESQITEYLSFYNMERFHNKLGDLSPIKFREKAAA
ncbi:MULTISPECIES: IS3 family transposase [unclassified Paenibacillus]|uniref:IS3 family transposase n=1 Tax=unclassified Paenibacillus TaxID=185978 RepID=UPI0009DCEEE0|nr:MULTISPECIES: IS3 family transposase [unclassified Paenibacillus]